ncbi:MAG: sulfur carrier protein ThiS [Phycisphaerales bacterium]
MLISVNGQSTELPSGASLGDLITRLGLDKAICAAEVNQALVPRDERETTLLNEGDKVEIVTLVGGG